MTPLVNFLCVCVGGGVCAHLLGIVTLAFCVRNPVCLGTHPMMHAVLDNTNSLRIAGKSCTNNVCGFVLFYFHHYCQG